MGIDTTQYGQGLDTAGNKMTSFVSGVKNGLSQMASSLIGIGAAIGSGFGIDKLLQNATSYGSTLYDLQTRMNMTSSQAAQFANMLQLAGTSSDSFSTAMERLDRSYESSSTAGNLAKNTLDALGVSLKNGATGPLKSWNDQLAALAKGYQIANAGGYGQEFMTNVFAARGTDMASLLQNYQAYNAAASQVTDSGMSTTQAKQTQVDMDSLKISMEQLGYVASASLMPIATTIIPPLVKIIGMLAVALRSVMPYILGLAAVLGTLSVLVLARTWIIWFVDGLSMMMKSETVAAAVTILRNAILALNVAFEENPIGLILGIVAALILLGLAAMGVDKWLTKIAQDTNTAFQQGMGQNMTTLNKQMQDALNNVQKLGASFDELYQVGTDMDLPNLADLPGQGGGTTTTPTGGGGPSPKTVPTVMPNAPWKPQKPPSGGGPGGGVPIVVPPPPEGAWDSFWEKIKKNWDEVKKKLGQAWPPIPVPDLGAALAAVWAKVVADALKARQDIENALRGLNPFPTLEALGAAAWAKVRADAQQAGRDIENDLKGINPFPALEAMAVAAWAKIKLDVKNAASAIGSALKDINPFPILEAGLTAALAWMLNAWKKHSTLIIAIFVGLGVILVTVLSGGLDIVGAALAALGAAFVSGFGAIAVGAEGAASVMGLAIGGGLAALGVLAAHFKDQIIGFFQEIPAKAQQVWQDIATSYTSLIGQLPTETSSVVDSIKGFFAGIGAGCSQEFQAIVQAFSSWVGQLPGIAQGIVQSVIGEFQSIVADVSSIFNSIVSDANNVVSSIRGVVGSMGSAIGSAFGGGSNTPMQGASGAVPAMPQGSTSLGSMWAQEGIIPSYGTGGEVSSPQLALVGEVPEYIIPKSQLSGMLGAAAAGGGGSGAQIDYAAMGTAVAAALGSAKIEAIFAPTRAGLLNLNRQMQPVNQAETLRRGGATS
jgi:hypothetical protein